METMKEDDDGQQQHIDNIYQVINDNPGITAEEISTYTGYDADPCGRQQTS